MLLGEASHGTHEFYRARAELTRRLVEEKGFTAVAVEGDWPRANRVNRYVQGGDEDGDAEEALADFHGRFPSWMWRNAEVMELVGWLRAFNEEQPERKNRVGFHGLDLYSLHASMGEVVRYLGKVDQEEAARARQSYSCLEDFGGDPQHYGYAAAFELSESCEHEVVRVLTALEYKRAAYVREGDLASAEEYFNALQNARLVVWAHNSHLGDARATEPGWSGQLNDETRAVEPLERTSLWAAGEPPDTYPTAL